MCEYVHLLKKIDDFLMGQKHLSSLVSGLGVSPAAWVLAFLSLSSELLQRDWSRLAGFLGEGLNVR